MNRLHSIEPIQKVFATQNHPVLVRCNDLKYYVCKHSKHVSCETLFNEYLSSRFLGIWNIYALPPFLITIHEEHLPSSFVSGMLQPASLKHSLIGYPYVKNQKEVTLFEDGLTSNLSDRKKIVAPQSLVRIGLFDLWLGNDDRNANNYNLLLESKSDGYHFIPIDHEAIFNTNNLPLGLNLQTESDSLILTSLFKSVVSKRIIKEILTTNGDDLRDYFYLCTTNCKNELDNILEEIPHDWNISIDVKRELILKNVFSSKWINDVFREFLINLKHLL